MAWTKAGLREDPVCSKKLEMEGGACKGNDVQHSIRRDEHYVRVIITATYTFLNIFDDKRVKAACTSSATLIESRRRILSARRKSGSFVYRYSSCSSASYKRHEKE